MLTHCNAYDLILVHNETSNEYAISDSLFDYGGADEHSNCSVDLVVVNQAGESLQVGEGEIKDRLPEIAAMLEPGKNKARFLLTKQHEQEIIGIATANVFLWSTTDKIVVVDVDGTITTSTMKGFLHTAVFQNYSDTYCHDGVCEFLSSIPSVCFLFLTNRPISYAGVTRTFLNELRQGQHSLPDGPLIGFTGGLAGVFQMDLYAKNAHEFKYDTLNKYVTRPFCDLNVDKDVFYAGFGNTVYDMHAYHNTGIHLHRMFLINKASVIYCLDKSDVDELEDSSVQQRALEHPKQYALVRGTRFDGYQDEKLLSHVLGYKKI